MTNITIPPEALEAAKNAWYAHQHMGTDDRMTAAILAALENWPRMERNFWADDGAPVLILPVPQEPSHE